MTTSPESPDALEAALAAVDAKIELIVARADAQEKLVANLIMAQVELTSALQQVMVKLMEPASEDERKAFREQLTTSYKTIIQEWSKASDAVAKHSDPPDTTISRMVREHLNRGNDEPQDLGPPGT